MQVGTGPFRWLFLFILQRFINAVCCKYVCIAPGTHCWDYEPAILSLLWSYYKSYEDQLFELHEITGTSFLETMMAIMNIIRYCQDYNVFVIVTYEVTELSMIWWYAAQLQQNIDCWIFSEWYSTVDVQSTCDVQITLLLTHFSNTLTLGPLDI